jgi:hypothetical protein
MKKIKFTNLSGLKELEMPKPASQYVPDWFKNMGSYIGNKKEPNGEGMTTATVKKCIPVFDAITAGYIIETPADIYVKHRDGQQYFEWSSFGLISFHPIEQAPTHPLKNQHSYPKFKNMWAIKTPKGYSTLFVQPFHRESILTILPGVVDTDTYSSPVNFPFVVNDPEFEGLIPKGTPIVQLIPFKRDTWKRELGGDEHLLEQIQITSKLQTKFFDRYKTMFWHRKEYK